MSPPKALPVQPGSAGAMASHRAHQDVPSGHDGGRLAGALKGARPTIDLKGVERGPWPRISRRNASHAKETARITQIASLRDVQRLLEMLSESGARLPATRIRVAALSARADRIRAELRLNAALNDCGCTAGTAGMTLAVLGYLGALWRGAPPLDLPGALLLGVAIGLVGGVVGKGVGLVRARTRLWRELRVLEQELME
jgi:hypothetical protein